VVGAHGGIRAAIVDDDQHWRARGVLALEEAGIEVPAAASSYEDAVTTVRDVDVAVVELRLRGKSGIELARELRGRGITVLIYTAARDREALRAALRAGACGIAFKGESTDELVTAVRSVVADESYFAPGVHDLLARQPGGRLTPREREVLFLLATGLTNVEVAAELGLSPETTRTQLRNAMRKLDANTRLHAVAIAGAEGEITLP
jgi:DNA-binding NarL/FixJ family response regulator